MLRFLVLLCLLLPLGLAAQPFTNTDFEAATAMGQPVGWTVDRLVNPDGALVKAPARSGRALRLSSPFTAYDSGLAYQERPLISKELTRYVASVLVRTEDVAGDGAGLYAYGKDKSGNSYLNYVATEGLSGTNDWTEVSIDFYADARIDTIRLGCSLYGTGTAWFDDLSWQLTPFDTTPIGDTAAAYLDTVFQYLTTQALDRGQIDWPALRREADLLSAGAATTAETYGAIQYTLQRVNRHSFFMAPEETGRLMGTDKTGEEEEADLPEIDYTQGHRLDKRIAYLSMPDFSSGDPAMITRFADSLQALIAALDTKQTTGWVLDLRENTGGNCWPMLAGIGPLLGKGVCGYFIDRDGENGSAWSYRNGGSYQGGSRIAEISGRPYRLKNPHSHIAVLTGPSTASSGEVTTIAFRGRKNTRSFGQPTAGYSTTNTNIMLPDGAMLLLTVSVYADRNRNIYGDEVIPDAVIEKETTEAVDPTLEAALAWLRGGK